MDKMLTAAEIDSWAKENPRRAQELLPELVLRLILRTSDRITDYEFPIEKGIQYSGYDGVLVSEEKIAISQMENLCGNVVRMMIQFQNSSQIFRREVMTLWALM